jgi:hypothetical protein
MGKHQVLPITIVSALLVIQHATRMRHITLPCVAYLAVPHFSTLSKKGTIFGRQFLKIKCVL